MNPTLLRSKILAWLYTQLSKHMEVESESFFWKLKLLGLVVGLILLIDPED